MWNGSTQISMGTVSIDIFNPKTATKHTAQFVIVPGKRTPILGCKTVQDMGLVTMQTKKYECAAVTNDKLKTKEKYISEYHDVFNREFGTLEALQIYS